MLCLLMCSVVASGCDALAPLQTDDVIGSPLNDDNGDEDDEGESGEDDSDDEE